MGQISASSLVGLVSARELPDGTEARIVTDAAGNWTVRIGAPRLPPAPAEIDSDTQYYVPYTKVHAETVAGAPGDAIWVDVSGSGIAYYVAMLDWWETGETFAVIEHDVVCRPDIVESFAQCPEPWCLYGYDPYCHEECREAWRNALGCTRFRAELINAVPDAVASIPLEQWDWRNMCDGLGSNLRAAGFTHHWHTPPVRHTSWVIQAAVN